MANEQYRSGVTETTSDAISVGRLGASSSPFTTHETSCDAACTMAGGNGKISQIESRTPHRLRGTDSGYVSQIDTPDSIVVEPFRPKSFSLSLREKFAPQRAKAPPLNQYDKPIPDAVRSRFHDLVELVIEPLYKQLDFDEAKWRRLSIKLKVIGKDEASAKPCIVVLCPREDLKKVRQFFTQPNIKAHFQPGPQCPDQPSFSLIIWGSGPVHTSAGGIIEVYGEDIPGSKSLCGSKITTCRDEPYRIARIGGAVMITHHDGSKMLYGMTAGHVFDTKDSDERHTVTNEEANRNSIASSYSAPSTLADEMEQVFQDERFCLFMDDEAEEEFQLDHFPICTRELSENDFSLPIPTQPLEPANDVIAWTKIGCGPLELPDIEESKSIDMDYALVELDDTSKLVSQPGSSPDQPSLILGGPLVNDRSVSVATISSTNGKMLGTLASSTSFLKMGENDGFVETYLLSLNDKRAIKCGDSGAWVVDSSNTALGHIVAVDDFGDAYVMPLTASLTQICKRLGAASVTLPTNEEVIAYVATHLSPNNSNKQECVNTANMSNFDEPTDATKSGAVVVPNNSNVSRSAFERNSDEDNDKNLAESKQSERATSSSKKERFLEESTNLVTLDGAAFPPSPREQRHDKIKWTKISRELVTPQALEEAGERFEERKEHVIVLRYVPREEIQELADRSEAIRRNRDSRRSSDTGLGDSGYISEPKGEDSRLRWNQYNHAVYPDHSHYQTSERRPSFSLRDPAVREPPSPVSILPLGSTIPRNWSSLGEFYRSRRSSPNQVPPPPSIYGETPPSAPSQTLFHPPAPSPIFYTPSPPRLPPSAPLSPYSSPQSYPPPPPSPYSTSYRGYDSGYSSKASSVERSDMAREEFYSSSKRPSPRAHGAGTWPNYSTSGYSSALRHAAFIPTSPPPAPQIPPTAPTTQSYRRRLTPRSSSRRDRDRELRESEHSETSCYYCGSSQHVSCGSDHSAASRSFHEHLMHRSHSHASDYSYPDTPPTDQDTVGDMPSMESDRRKLFYFEQGHRRTGQRDKESPTVLIDSGYSSRHPSVGEYDSHRTLHDRLELLRERERRASHGTDSTFSSRYPSDGEEDPKVGRMRRRY